MTSQVNLNKNPASQVSSNGIYGVTSYAANFSNGYMNSQQTQAQAAAGMNGSPKHVSSHYPIFSQNPAMTSRSPGKQPYNNSTAMSQVPSSHQVTSYSTNSAQVPIGFSAANASPRRQIFTPNANQEQSQQLSTSKMNIGQTLQQYPQQQQSYSQVLQQQQQQQQYQHTPIQVAKASSKMMPDYSDSFSGSIIDEGISIGGGGLGGVLIPESRSVQGSKQQLQQQSSSYQSIPKAATYLQTQMQQPPLQIQINSPIYNESRSPRAPPSQQNLSIQNTNNDLAQQLNQIRTRKPTEQSAPPSSFDPNTFKIINKDTGEVFDIRNMEQNSKNNQQSQQQQQQQPLNLNMNQININNNQPANQSSTTSSAWTELWNKKRKINTDFLLLAKINNTNGCLELLDKRNGDLKADVNIKDSQNEWTPLHYASQNGNTRLVSQLLYHEAMIDAVSTEGQTPLILASIGGYEDVLQLLITAGADINAMDSVGGNTALHHACINGNKKIVEILLKKPSLDYKALNLEKKESYDVCKNEDIKKVFDNFFVFQKAMMKKNPKVRIFNTNQDTVSQMFTVQNHNQSAASTTQQSSQVSNQFTTINDPQNPNSKSSFTNSEGDTSNLSDEDKIGPNSFIVHGLVGKGSFGEVYLVEKKDSQQLYAMKVLHKSKIMRHNLTRYALTERNVLSVTKHSFIVRLNYAFQTPDKLFLILKYCPGGDLAEHLQKEKRFTEDRVRNYLAEITLALEHLHKKDVIFRDLKPDNVVLDHEGHAMLTDFGLSKEGVLDHSTGAKSFCGSVAYLAPEMLKRCGHGKAVDWYLLGVVMYELLVGIPPYYANNKDELFQNIEQGHLKLPSYLSAEARSLLKALLQRNPVKRLGSGKGDADEIKAHPFFNSINWEEAEQRKLKVPVPNRKIRISTKFDPNIFDHTSFVENGKEHIAGWSFADPNSEQSFLAKQM